MLDALPLLVVVALVGVTALVLRRRSGVARPDGHAFTPAELAAAGADTRRPTFVLFTAPGCSTCGPTRAMVEDAAGRRDAAVVVLDATEHHELATAHRVLRAPTVFLVQPDGSIVGRISGLPHRNELTGMLDPVDRNVDTAA
jgi:thioredoxin-like negative regulator of GroEL